MKLTLENTQHLTSCQFIEELSIKLWESENKYLLDDPKKPDVPGFFYTSAYLIEFDTELQMQGLTTLLTNSATYNFENALNSFRIIGSNNLAKTCRVYWTLLANMA